MDDRRRLLTGTVLGRDQERVGELIPAIGDLDRDRCGVGPPLPQIADEVEGAAERRHRPPQATISRVIAIGSDIKLRRRRRPDGPTAAPRTGENPNRHHQRAENPLAPSAVDSHQTPPSPARRPFFLASSRTSACGVNRPVPPTLSAAHPRPRKLGRSLMLPSARRPRMPTSSPSASTAAARLPVTVSAGSRPPRTAESRLAPASVTRGR